MKFFKIIEYYTGRKASFFSVITDDNQDDEFSLLAERLYSTEHKDKLLKLISKIQIMADKTGTRDFFKDEGANLVFRFNIDNDEAYPIRIYCIKYGSENIILGGGGIKLPTTQTYQEQDDLNSAVTLLRTVDKTLNESNIKGYEIPKVLDCKFEL